MQSGKARFNRFLDTLANHLRSGQSIMNDLPVAVEPTSSDTSVSVPIPSLNNADPLSGPIGNSVPEKPPQAGEQEAAESSKPREPRPEKASSTSTSSKWNLFGFKES